MVFPRRRDLGKGVEVGQDAVPPLAGSEVGRDGVHDVTSERRGQQADLELVEVARVDIHIGLSRSNLLESSPDSDGVVAGASRRLEGLVVGNDVAERRLARSAPIHDIDHRRDLLDIGEIQRRWHADVRP